MFQKTLVDNDIHIESVLSTNKNLGRFDVPLKLQRDATMERKGNKRVSRDMEDYARLIYGGFFLKMIL